MILSQSNVRPFLTTNAVAAGFSLFVCLVLGIPAAMLGFAAASAVIPFAVVMLLVSIATSTLHRAGALLRWHVAVAVSWALTAPLGNWISTAMDRANPSVNIQGPVDFNPLVWLWALIPLAVYAAVGSYRLRKTAN